MKRFFKLFDPRSPFLPSLVVIFAIWTAYRLLFSLPVWVEESLLKAVVFGIPPVIYARQLKKGHDRLGLSNKLFWHGMFLGLFVGALYEFIAVISLMLGGRTTIQRGLIDSPLFWGSFFLALMTAWWESLFFFGYALNRIQDAVRREIPAVVLSAFVFVAFHAPLRFLIEGFGPQLMAQMFVLFLFAVGQAVLFLRTKSIFTITLSHALWGLVLLVYSV